MRLCDVLTLLPPQVVGDADPRTAGHGADDSPDGEFEFLPGAAATDGMQTLGTATDEQAAASAAARQTALDSTQQQGDAAALEDADMDDAVAQDAAAETAALEQLEASGPELPAAEPHGSLHRQRAGAALRESGPALMTTEPEVPAQPAGAAFQEEDADVMTASDLRGDAALVAIRLKHASLADEEADAFDPITTYSEQELAALRREAEASLAEWKDSAATAISDDAARASDLWARFEALTMPLTAELCEQLRLILEPTLAARMQGDYRTGKRLNMRKIIPYLASDFRRDKIWLRRSKPSVRRYQVRYSPSPFPHCYRITCVVYWDENTLQKSVLLLIS